MMKNTQENTKTKNNVSLIIAILGVIVCLVFIVMMMFPGGHDVAPDPTPTPDPPPGGAREYWTAELRFHENNWTPPFLKRISVDDGGSVVKIESVRSSEENVREEFFYENGRLEYSETYSISPVSNMAFMSKGSLEQKLYETRYVYMGDIIVRAEVYVDGVPTRSYDKYVYKVGGELSAIEKYEKGKLEITYFYNGKDYPERVEHTNGVSYDLEYDENGNLTRATSEDFLVEIDYENGYPTRFYKAYYDKKASDESVKASFVADTQKNETITTYVYGDNGEILEETSEIIVTYYNKGEQTHIEGYTDAYTYEYDDENRLTDVKHYLGEKFSYWHRYAYDLEGNLVSEVSFRENGTKFLENLVTRTNENGLTVEITHIVSNDVSSFEVDKYDKDGLLVKRSYMRPDRSVMSEETYEYYPSGAMKKMMMVNSSASETWIYAENGNIEKYLMNYHDHDQYDVTYEYVKSDVYYGFMRWGGFRYTFSLPLTVSEYQTTTNYTYREDLTLEKKTVYFTKGGYNVYECDEDGNIVKETQYDAAGNVIKELYYTAENNNEPKG